MVGFSVPHNTNIHKIFELYKAFFPCILPHFATKLLYSFTNFRILFLAVVYDFSFFDFVLRLKFSLSIGMRVHCTRFYWLPYIKACQFSLCLGEYVCKQVNLICRKRESVC